MPKLCKEANKIIAHKIATKQLTKKQGEFIKEHQENGGNGTRAALKVYDTDKYGVAESVGVENLSKPAIQKTVQECINAEFEARHKKGFFEKAGEVISEAVEAVLPGKDAFPDHRTRLSAVKTGADIMQAVEDKGDTVRAPINIRVDEIKVLLMSGKDDTQVV